MWLLFAAASAVCYGAADFCGGLAARRASILSTIVLSQLCGLALAALCAPLVGPNEPRFADLAWGGLAGLAGAVGLVFFYRALASTVIAVASPTAAVSGAAFPVLFGLLLGERPSVWGWVGLAIALVAIAALSASSRGKRADSAARRALFLGLVSGLGFGGFFIMISRTGASSGLWPLVAARICSVSALLVASLVTRRPIAVELRVRAAVVGAGILDMSANILYVLAVRVGYLALVSVVVSLYAAPTVVLARVVLKEQVSVWRIAGLALAVSAVALMGLP